MLSGKLLSSLSHLDKIIMDALKFLAGFGNEHQTEALENALPVGQFSPQICPYGLYAEQLSTSAFTAPRHQNRRTWCYRIQPSVCQGEYHEIESKLTETAPSSLAAPINPMRWNPPSISEAPADFIDSWATIVTNGSAQQQIGCAIHLYKCNKDMDQRFFSTSDGELLITPQLGGLLIDTELGRLEIHPGEIAVIPRAVKFRVRLTDDTAIGYLCENYGSPFALPERGIVGANGFANDRDFLYPTAYYEDISGQFELIGKFSGRTYRADIDHSPLNVVAWTGNSAPYQYDLSRFNVINSVSYDHCDPSIFTVLTSVSDTAGMANLDFVIFPPRWSVSENTFRPPWYHRNIMSEFMGLIKGQYDAKKEGFEPGGMSLHNSMTPHGPDEATFNTASKKNLEPEYHADTLAFMLESRYPMIPTDFAMNCQERQKDYQQCWQGLKNNFNKGSHHAQ